MIPAPRALAFTYWMITRHMDDDQRLEVDLILKRPGAQDRRDRRNIEAAEYAGIEVG